jgi:anti-sigma B factor antagonist
MSADDGLELSRDVRETDAGPVAIVRARGDIDLASADQLAESMRAAAADSSSGLVLDLTAVEFMDSSGLRVVMAAVGEDEGGLALVVAPESPVSQLLELTDLDGRIPNFEGEDEAVGSVTGGESDG